MRKVLAYLIMGILPAAFYILFLWVLPITMTGRGHWYVAVLICHALSAGVAIFICAVSWAKSVLGMRP